MICEFEVVQPPTQGELMRCLNATKAGAAVLELAVKPTGSEFTKRLAQKRGETVVHFVMSVDSIHDINGDPYVLGHSDDDATTLARLEVVQTEQPDRDERPLTLVVSYPQ